MTIIKLFKASYNKLNTKHHFLIMKNLQKDEMDSNATPVPILRHSLLKESNATQNPAASQKDEDLKQRIKLTLERKAPNGYGIGLARERKREGVFIVSLLPGGVADLDGRSR